MQQLKKILHTWGKPIGITILLLVAFFAGNVPSFSKRNVTKPHVLGTQTTSTPQPKADGPLDQTSAPVTIVNNITVVAPTSVPVSDVPAPTVVPVVIVVTPTHIPTVLPTETPSPTASPTPAIPTVTVQVDYAGEHTASTYTASLTAEETGWEVIQNAVGLGNLHYTDYGGSLGVFITGFNGVDAASNQYYDFQVNGVSSNVGVSSYVVQPTDTLRFVLTSF
ncbi:MAG TPA: DUF4430 domain-containing protein [Candidatus Eisenbacteria bacterium]|nr:DUF4430 domain-containing protein [Candidatus Eisenbacteria bacterium]